MAVSFTYGGYQQTINFGEEIEDAPKVMPRGIVMGMFVIIALYVLVNYSYYSIIGFESLKEAKGVASIVIEKYMDHLVNKYFLYFYLLLY